MSPSSAQAQLAPVTGSPARAARFIRHLTPDQESAIGTVRNVTILGPAGRLEAVLNLGATDAPFSALVCHPHPAFGGTLHNKVVYHAMKAINDQGFGLGWPVLRFNFRGAGLSEGEHDGMAEASDVLAALEWLDREFRRPILLSGFSFGAAMALRACRSLQAAIPGQQPPVVRALVALGLPTNVNGRAYDYSFLSELTLPKLFVSGDSDQFAPRAQLTKLIDSASERTQLVFVRGADHFFTGQLEFLQNEIAKWIKEQLA